MRVQPGFKSELLTSVEVFQKDVTDFGTSYDTVSIMMLSEVKEGDDTVLKLAFSLICSLVFIALVSLSQIRRTMKH